MPLLVVKDLNPASIAAPVASVASILLACHASPAGLNEVAIGIPLPQTMAGAHACASSRARTSLPALGGKLGAQGMLSGANWSLASP